MKYFTLIGILLLSLITLSYGRQYDMCSLARELHHVHDVPKHELPDWVCTAQHESNFRTDAMNRDNDDGSTDWGIFQINDQYWCVNPNRKGLANGCNVECGKLAAEDITAAVRCTRHIKNLERGWGAWVAWLQHCQHNKPDVSICFGDTAASYGYALGFGFDVCSLARELHNNHGVPKKELPDWICMAWNESRFNTTAINKENSVAPGSWDWGIFQISDEYWCHRPERPGTSIGCGVNCNELLKNDIKPSVDCAKIVKNFHGFAGWVGWRKYCQGENIKPWNTDYCFTKNTNGREYSV